jgi:glycosyltransferase involved in cell wall biosynthesis
MPNPNATAHQPDPQPLAPLITVAICTRNRPAFLARAVHSVLPQLTDKSELLIVDSASTDNTPAVAAELAARDSRVKTVRETVPGISTARNAALNHARGKFVLFLDDDETARPEWLATYERFLSAPPSGKIAGVGSVVLNEFEVSLPRWADPDAAFQCGDEPKCLPYPGSIYGGNAAYHREIAIAVGMFDPQLGRREDSDLNLRLQEAGYELWWLPGAPIVHFTPASRLKFRVILRERFNDGRYIAVQRLKFRRKGLDRGLYRAARLIGGPFQALLHLLAAAVRLPCRHPKGIEHLLQASRNFGIAWGMLTNWKIHCVVRPDRNSLATAHGAA